jgi:hypothetical protein
MSPDPPPKREFIDPLVAYHSLETLAKGAHSAKIPTIDIVIHQNRLAWRAHGKPHNHQPPIATLETQKILRGLDLFTAATVRAQIESALRIHNSNLET